MKKLVKPACLLLYLLTILVFFFIGASLAAILGMADGQGLAGGAIIFFYGMISAGCAFLGSVLFAHQGSLSNVIKANKILGIVLAIFAAYFAYQIMTK